MRTSRCGSVALLSAALVTGCAAATSLGSELKTVIAQSEGGGFQLSDLDTAKGSRFLVACPYESRASIEDRLGFSWSDAPDYSQSDDVQSIIITDENAVTSHTELARDAGDFCSDGQWELSPIDTNLSVARSADSLVVRST